MVNLISLVLSCLLLLATIVFAILWVYGMLGVKAPFVGLPGAILPKLVEIIKFKPGDVFYDLGSGDGRIVLALAKYNPQTQFVGIEKGPIPFIMSKINWWLKGKPENVKLVCGDFFQQDLKSATQIFTYLFPEVMDQLLPKMKVELMSGAQVFSCDFKFSQKDFETEIDLGRKPIQLGKKVYIYCF